MEDKYYEVEKIIKNEIKFDDYDITCNENNIIKIINIYRLLDDDDISNIISLIEDLETKEGIDYEN